MFRWPDTSPEKSAPGDPWNQQRPFFACPGGQNPPEGAGW
jgi:hypothetical protein